MPSVGSAYVTVRVNTKGFEASLAKSLNKLSKDMEKRGDQMGKDFIKGLSNVNPDTFFNKFGASADKAATRVDNAAKKMGNSLDSVGLRSIDVQDTILSSFDAVSTQSGETGRDVKKNLGDAFTAVKGEAKDLEQTLTNIGNGGGRGGRGLKKAGGDFNFFGRILNEVADGADSAKRLINSLFNAAAFGGNALAGLVGGLSATASGLFAVASNAAAAAPAVSVLTNAFIGLAQVGGTIAVSTQGVGDALQAGFDAANEAAKGITTTSASLGTAAQSAARAVRDAKENLQEAYQDAARAAEDASRRIRAAELQVAVTQQQVLAAQQALNAARKEGLEQLEDIQFAAEDAALAEERASLNLEDAFAALQETSNLPPDSKARREAELAFKEAELQLREAKDRREDADKAQKQAAKNGVKGTQAMQDALQQLAQAQQAAIDAQNALTEARRNEAEVNQRNARSIRDAQEALADAQLRVANASAVAADNMNNVEKAAAEYEAALKKLSPAQRQFVRTLVATKPALEDVKRQIAQPLFEGLNRALTTMINGRLFPKVTDSMKETSGELGNIAARAADVANTPTFSARFGAVLDTNNKALSIFGRTGTNLMQVLNNLAFAARPLIVDFANWTRELTRGWLASQNAEGGMKKLKDTIGNAADRVREFAAFFKQIARTVIIFGKAGNEAANAFDNPKTKKVRGYIPELTASLRRFNRTFEDGKGPTERFEKLVGFFGEALKNMNAVGRAAKTVIQPFIDLGGNPKIAEAFDKIAKSDVFDRLGKTAAEALPAFADLVVNILDIIAALSESPGMKVFLSTLSAITGVISTIINLPGVGQLLFIAGAVFGVVRALRLVKRVGVGIFGGVFGDIRKLPNSVNNAAAGITKGSSKFRNSGRSIGLSFTSAFNTTTKQRFASGFAEIGRQISTGARTAAKGALKGFRQGAPAATNAGAGRALMQGVAIGIKEGTVAAAGAARTAGAKIVKSMKAAMGVKSPSTLTMSAGRFLMSGLSLGIVQGTAGATATATKAGRSVGTAVGKGATTGVATSTASVGKSFGKLGKASKGLSLVTRGLGGAFNFALGPLSTIMLIVELLLPLFISLYKHNKTFKTIVDAVWGAMKVIFEQVGKAFKGLYDGFVAGFNWIKSNWPILLAVLTGPFGLAVLFITKKWDVITGVVGRVFDWIKKHWPDLLIILTGPFGLAFLFIRKNKDRINKALKSVIDWVKKNWPIILALLAGPFGLAVLLIIKNKDRIVSVIKQIPGKIKEFFSHAWDVVSEKFRAAVDNVKEFFRDKLTPWLESLPDKVGNKLSGLWDGMVDGFKSAAGFIVDKVNDWLIDPLNWVLDKFGAGKIDHITVPGLATGGWVKGPGGPKDDRVLRALSNGEYVLPASSAKNIGPKDLEYMRKFGKLPSGRAEDAMGGLWGIIKAGGKAVLSGVKSVGGAIKNGAQFAFKWVVNEFAKKLPSNVFTDFFVGGLKWAAGKFTSFGKNLDEQAAVAAPTTPAAVATAPNGKTAFPVAGPFSYNSRYYYGLQPDQTDPYRHTGSDFPAKIGTPLVAMARGVVRSTTFLGDTSYGRYVVVDYPTFSTLYAHMNSFASGIHAGTTVERGTRLGTVGEIGRASGPHLHIEVAAPGGSFGSMTSTVDPVAFLRKLGFKFAKGGVAPATDGGILSVIAEAGKAERIEPLDRDGFSKRDRAILRTIQDARGNTFHIVINNPVAERATESVEGFMRRRAIEQGWR